MIPKTIEIRSFSGPSVVDMDDSDGPTIVVLNQGPTGDIGPAGPNEITTATETNLTGFIYGDGTNVGGATAASDWTEPNTLVVRDSNGGITGYVIRATGNLVIDEPSYAGFHVLDSAASATRNLTLPDASGVISLEGHTHSAADITSGTFNNDRINFAAPSAIGSGIPNSGAFTTLSATGTATLPHIHGSLAGDLYIHVRNTSGAPLTRGTPVYIVGNVGDTDRVQVAAADNTDPAKMPAVGLLDQDLANNADGDAVILGELPAANTNAYTLNQELFVGVGALTGTKPTTGEVQSAGVVARVQTNTGVIVVNMQGRRPSVANHTLKSTTGDPVSGSTGEICINTFDNNVKIYADGGWREIATW